MTDTARDDPPVGARQPLPGVPKHLQEAVQHLVQPRADKPSRTDNPDDQGEKDEKE